MQHAFIYGGTAAEVLTYIMPAYEYILTHKYNFIRRIFYADTG